MTKNDKKNGMYYCPICGSEPQIKFSVGGRNEYGYTTVAKVQCKNGCLCTENVEFGSLFQQHKIWNELVEQFGINL